jgi:hypothetical protein
MNKLLSIRALFCGAAAWSSAVVIMGQTWQAAGSLPTGGAARQYAAGVNVNGVLYGIGGTPWQNGGDQDGCVHQFAAGTWSSTAPLDGAGPIISAAAGLDGLGRIVVYGGFLTGNNEPGPDKVYDPVQGLGTSIAARPTPTAAIGYFAWASDVQQRLYGFGGGPGAGGPNSGYSDRYDATTNSWTILAAMPTPAADACAAYDNNGHLLVFGGIDQAGNARLSNVAQYVVATNTWSDTAIADLPIALSGARAVRGADGRIYVIGGETGPLDASATSAAVYKLELASNTWVSVAALTTPRKWFAAVLGNDDNIYAIGGDNDTGGTSTVEKLFTPRCPGISGPTAQTAYAGSLAAFSVAVDGAAPFVYQWRKDGADLIDGPTGHGSTISGATTTSLKITTPGASDAGAYDVVVTNACGSVASSPADLALQQPPAVPSNWTVTNIHPVWADGPSYAYGVANGRIGGAAVMTTTLPDGRVMNLSHPILWDAATQVPADITPPGSVGGAIYDAEGVLLAGWFWHTYPCWGGGQWWTCAWQSAGYWSGDPPAFTEVHMSGAEYDSVAATDGQRMVSNSVYDYGNGSHVSYPYLWTPPQSVTFLDPGPAVGKASVAAIDGQRQYGSLRPEGSYTIAHAVMWGGTAASMVEVHPTGYTQSWIAGAGDGQAVGQVDSRAALWAGGTAEVVELHQPGWTTNSYVYATHGGVQVGSSPSGAALWTGSADLYFNLDAFVPPGFTFSEAQDVEVSPSGEIIAVGYGFNSATNRYEALVWRAVSGAPTPGDLNCDGVVDFDDINPLVLALSDPAGYHAAYPACNILNGDCNGDGFVDFDDINSFVALLSGGGSP